MEGLLAEAASSNDPYPAYRALRDMGPVHLTGRGDLLVVSHQACAQVLRDGDRWKAPGSAHYEHRRPTNSVAYGLQQLYRTFLTLDPPSHTAQRKSLGRHLTARAVHEAAPAIDRLATQHVTALLSSAPLPAGADFVSTLAGPYSMQVLCHILGLPREDGNLLLEPATTAAHLQEPTPTRHQLADAGQAMAVLVRHMQDGLAQHRVKPDGMLAALARAEQRPGTALPAGYAARTASLLLIAGSPIVSTFLTSATHTLLRCPGQAQSLLTSPHRLADAVEELLRFDPPIQFLQRIAARDGTFHGRTVHRGQRVRVALGAAAHDPTFVPDPDRLHLNGPRPRHLSFGAGIHYCVGATLARREITAALHALLPRIAELAAPAPPTRRPGSTQRHSQSFTVVAAPHRPARLPAPSHPREA